MFHRRSNVFLWGAFLGWCTFGFRLAVLRDISWVGFLDDASLGLALLCAAAALDSQPRWIRFALLAAGSLLLATFNLANAAFHSFFDALLNLDSYQLLAQAEGAATSIDAVLTPNLLALHAFLPFVLLLGALAKSAYVRPRLVSGWVWTGLGLALALSGLHHAVRHEEYLMTENNGVMHVGRQWLERQYLLHGANTQRRNTRILETVSQTYNLPNVSQYGMAFNPRYPLLRMPVNPTAHPRRPLNVVLVLMESFRLKEAGTGRPQDVVLAPRLHALAKDSILFTQFYANGHQTVRGEMSTVCSTVPNYSGGQVYSMFEDVSLACLPEILRRQGYETHWISSYTAGFGNKRGFLAKHGVQVFHDDVEISKRPLKKPKVGWGPSDEDLAEFAVDVLDHARGPFFAEVMTLSNHHPFNYDFGIPRPKDIIESKERELYRNYLMGQHYTDFSVGHFMDLARTRSWFKDTVFVILGDHGVWVFPEKGERSLTPAERIETYYRTPLLIYAPAHLEAQTVNLVGSQIDIAPTVLDILGVEAPNAFQGASLLQDIPLKQRFAVMGNENSWSIRQGNRYCYSVGLSCFKDMPPYCPKGYEPRPAGHACFETEKDLLDYSDPRPIIVLNEREGKDVLARGQRLVENNAYLLLHDAFFPREALAGMQLEAAAKSP
jgi:phosphoglycerol transferase MdoB-like AlkP superfamily enzyme